MVRWNNDPEVEYFVDCDLPKSLPECEIWFRVNVPSRDYRLLAIEEAGGRIIGDLELDHISWRSGEAELRIRIGEKDYWNKGYGTEAVRRLLDMAFAAMGLRRIHLKVYRFNRRAISCYEKNGFRKEGYLHRRTGADWKDILLMSIDQTVRCRVEAASTREDPASVAKEEFAPSLSKKNILERPI